MPATTLKPRLSISSWSRFGSLGKKPNGPVSITEKPAWAISSSAVSQWICFSSSGNQTPHWSGHTPIVSLL